MTRRWEFVPSGNSFCVRMNIRKEFPVNFIKILEGVRASARGEVGYGNHEVRQPQNWGNFRVPDPAKHISSRTRWHRSFMENRWPISLRVCSVASRNLSPWLSGFNDRLLVSISEYAHVGIQLQGGRIVKTEIYRRRFHRERPASSEHALMPFAPQLRVRSIVLGFMHTEYTDYPPVKSVCPPSRSWRGDTFVQTKLKLLLQIREPLPVLGADCV